MKAYELTITIQGIHPEIMRNLLIPASLRFQELHLILQTVFEWQDYHLFEFSCPTSHGKHIITENPEEYDFPADDDSERLDAEETWIDDYFRTGYQCTYTYDFGDTWIHNLTIHQCIEDYPYPYPRIKGFSGNMIPEDCGGPNGYEHLIQVLDDPEHEDYIDMRNWAEMQGLHPFCLFEVNRALQHLLPWESIAASPDTPDWEVPLAIRKNCVPAVRKILRKLTWLPRNLPMEILTEAKTMRESLTDYLLLALDDAAEHLADLPENYFLPMYALLQLAEWKEPRTFPLLIKLSKQDPGDLEAYFSGFLYEIWASVMIPTYNGDLNALLSLVELPYVNHNIKGDVGAVLESLYRKDLLSRQELITAFQWMFDQYSNTDDFAELLAFHVISLQLTELLPTIKTLMIYGRIHPKIFGEFDEFVDYVYGETTNVVNTEPVTDAIEELKKWPCFSSTTTSSQSEDYLLQLKKERAEKEAAFYQIHPKGSTRPLPESEAEILAEDDIKRWLAEYPDPAVLSQHFDQESIRIDQLVYLALHIRRMPEWEQEYETPEYAEMRRNAYLKKAYRLYQDKCTRENIRDEERYDQNYMIHYECRDWVHEARRAMRK